jgi:hypothetical protein
MNEDGVCGTGSAAVEETPERMLAMSPEIYKPTSLEYLSFFSSLYLELGDLLKHCERSRMLPVAC